MDAASVNLLCQNYQASRAVYSTLASRASVTDSVSPSEDTATDGCMHALWRSTLLMMTVQQCQHLQKRDPHILVSMPCLFVTTRLDSSVCRHWESEGSNVSLQAEGMCPRNKATLPAAVLNTGKSAVKCVLVVFVQCVT